MRLSLATEDAARPLPPAYDSDGYYADPVEIKIPRELEPLPEHLTENPMNLLYFHHFLNHTARVLIPGKCGENALRTILAKSTILLRSV